MSGTMDKYFPLTPKVWPEIKDLIDNHHAQVSEFYFSDREDRAARLVIAHDLPEGGIGALEFVCRGVVKIVFLPVGEGDCRPECDFGADGTVCLRLSDEGTRISARNVMLRRRTEDFARSFPICGNELPKEAEDAVSLNDGWWQCPRCGDAWLENPRIEFSRCPGCRGLSHLPREIG